MAFERKRYAKGHWVNSIRILLFKGRLLTNTAPLGARSPGIYLPAEAHPIPPRYNSNITKIIGSAALKCLPPIDIGRRGWGLTTTTPSSIQRRVYKERSFGFRKAVSLKERPHVTLFIEMRNFLNSPRKCIDIIPRFAPHSILTLVKGGNVARNIALPK